MQQLNTDDLWVLRQLQNVGYRSAVIGGGAVRDAYFDHGPMDVDIFVWGSEYSNELIDLDYSSLTRKNIIKLLQLKNVKEFNADPMVFSWEYEEQDDVKFASDEYYTKQMVHVLGVWNVFISDFETQYQIIVLNKPPVEYVTRYFDIGLCMCYCDGTRIRYTNEFLTDAGNQTLTIAGDLTEEEYKHTIKHRVQKLQRRFPGYTLVDPLKDKVWPVTLDINVYDDQPF